MKKCISKLLIQLNKSSTPNLIEKKQKIFSHVIQFNNLQANYQKYQHQRIRSQHPQDTQPPVVQELFQLIPAPRSFKLHLPL